VITFPAGIKVINLTDGVYKQTRKIQNSRENVENFDDIIIKNGKLASPVRLKARWRSSNDMRNFFKNNCRSTVAKINGTIEEIYFDSDRFNPKIKKATFEKIPDLILKNTRGSKVLDAMGLSSYFDNPKSPQILEYLIQLITQQYDIILDFFSGSSTTAHAVMELNAEDSGNRRHIQVQLPEPVDPDSPAGKAGFKTIADIARKRIDLAGEKIKQDYAEQLAKRETPLDVGYRTYKLTDTNFVKWRESSAVDQGTLEQHLLDLRDSANDDATELALLTEVLLKQGYSLSEQVEKQTIAGLEVWSIGEHNLALAYMNEWVKPTLDQLRALVDREPERLIILEDAFQGDDELKTNLVQAAKTKRVELWAA
jgi:adenine-specific DNA-methyltransferase